MKIAVFILGILLVGTNAFWLYHVVDSSVTDFYRDDTIRSMQRTQDQLMAVIPELAGSQDRQKVVGIFQSATDEEPFEKAGCVWVGSVGLKFDAENELLAVTPLISVSPQGPCHDDL